MTGLPSVALVVVICLDTFIVLAKGVVHAGGFVVRDEGIYLVVSAPLAVVLVVDGSP